MIGNFGVTPTGVIIKQLSDISGQITSALGGDFGADFSFLSQTPEGQLINRLSQQVADLWQFGEQIYNSLYPGTASGPSLDQAESLVNVFRIPATQSVYNSVTISGTNGTVVPTTFQVSVPGSPSSIFQLLSQVTIGAGGTVLGTFVSTTTGPVLGPSGTLTIVTALTGVTGVNAGTAAQTGTNAETDSAYRARAASELNTVGTGTFSGLLQAIQRVTNVSQVYLFSNDTDSTVNGILPHSVLLIVVGGADQDIYNMIFAAKPAGINTNGTQTGAVIDSQGISHNVSFSRLVDVPVYVDVTIIPNTNPSAGPVFPPNGLALVQAAIIAYGLANFEPGDTVVVSALATPINSVPGVFGFTTLVGTAYPASSGANITMNPNQLAQFLAGVDGSSYTYVNVHE